MNYSPVKIYTAKSKIPNAGRGVFANEDIKSGELIEVCPVIEIPPEEIEILQNSSLTSYIYFFGKDKEKMFLPLGFGAIYNHSDSPNAKYLINQKLQTIEFLALTSIGSGEEVCVDYRQGNGTEIPLWFEKE